MSFRVVVSDPRGVVGRWQLLIFPASNPARGFQYSNHKNDRKRSGKPSAFVAVSDQITTESARERSVNVCGYCGSGGGAKAGAD
jgi:hypothetical protein